MSDQLPTSSAAAPAYARDYPPVMSVGNWFVTLFLLAIPIVNLIMLIVWSFSDSTNPNKRNYSRAALIWIFIWIVIGVLFTLFGAALGLESVTILEQPQ